MKKIFISTVSLSLLISSANAIECKKEDQELKSVRELIQTGTKVPAKDIGLVDGFRAMFEEGEASGQLRTVYVQNIFATETVSEIDNSAMAVGGALKFETAKYNGINAGFKLRYTEDIDTVSGDISKGERNDELSSSESVYSQLSEAYVDIEGCLFDFRLGRQVIDTPLADSDDIRMIPNTFEAFVMQYPSKTLNVTLGYLNRWQGVDAGLDDAWVNTGENGTSFVGAVYEDGVEASLWYYNISEQNSAIYADLSYDFELTKELSLTTAVQYLHESELNDSGVEANIYGALVELAYNDLTLGLAYSASSEEKGKYSFSGFGGGTLFTNMDIMIIDEITEDRKASAYVAGASYEIGDFSLLYAYGNFEGKADSLNNKAHIVEQDVGVEYNYDDELVAYIMYVLSEDKLAQADTENDWNHLRVMVNYNF